MKTIWRILSNEEVKMTVLALLLSIVVIYGLFVIATDAGDSVAPTETIGMEG